MNYHKHPILKKCGTQNYFIFDLKKYFTTFWLKDHEADMGGFLEIFGIICKTLWLLQSNE